MSPSRDLYVVDKLGVFHRIPIERATVPPFYSRCNTTLHVPRERLVSRPEPDAPLCVGCTRNAGFYSVYGMSRNM